MQTVKWTGVQLDKERQAKLKSLAIELSYKRKVRLPFAALLREAIDQYIERETAHDATKRS